MLDLMRKHARNWLVKTLIGMVIIVFVFYFGSIRGRDKAETIAILDNHVISYIELQREYNDLLALYRQRYGERLSDEVLKSLNVKQQAYNNLINKAVLLHKAKNLNIQVTDEEVRAFIMSNPSFHKGGAFDETLYQQILRYRKISPADFEANQRHLLTLMKLENTLQKAVKVSEKEIFDLYRMHNEKVKVLYISLPTKKCEVHITPDRTTLESYLKRHEHEFLVPEQVQVRYLTFSSGDYLSSIRISEEEITDYYERNKGQYRGKNGKVLPLPEVRKNIIAVLSHTKAMQKASAAAKEAHDTIYQTEDFEGYAKQKGLTIHSTGFFMFHNPPEELRQISNLPEVLSTLKQNETSPVLSDNKKYYLLKVTEKKPSHTPALREIEEKVRKKYVDEEAKRLCKEEAETLLARLKRGEPLHEVARERGIPVIETGFFSPFSPTPGLGPSQEVSEALVTLSERNPYPDHVFSLGDRYVIVKFKERGNVSTAEYEAKKGALKSALLKMKVNEYLLTWLEKNKEQMIKKGTLKILKEPKDL